MPDSVQHKVSSRPAWSVSLRLSIGRQRAEGKTIVFIGVIGKTICNLAHIVRSDEWVFHVAPRQRENSAVKKSRKREVSRRCNAAILLFNVANGTGAGAGRPRCTGNRRKCICADKLRYAMSRIVANPGWSDPAGVRILNLKRYLLLRA